MKRVRVASSVLASVGYDERGRTLEIEFVDGDVYQYFFVPGAVHQALMEAESHGAFFNTEIRGRYPHRRE